MTSKFNHELYKCKAKVVDSVDIVHGYYVGHSSKGHGSDSIFVDEYDAEMDDIYTNVYDINPYTLCRNTGIKIKNDYLYEFDLVLYGNGLSQQELGFIDFDELQKSYVIRTSLNYKSYKEISKYGLEIVGNIFLKEDDYKKMQKYSDERDENYSPNPKVECRSTQKLNKIARQFLP